MTITLELTAEQGHHLQESAARHDADAVRRVLLQALDVTVEQLLSKPDQPSLEQRRTLLDELAEELAGAPSLSEEAVSRAGIYGDHP